MTQLDFENVVQQQVNQLAEAPALQKLARRQLTLADYHQILLAIFHQVYEGPGTFALAAGLISSSRPEVKSYLMHHAEEEKLHWRWIVSDLKNTGYKGPEPQLLPPRPAAAAYIGYNHYIALKYPTGRLAIAAVLESIGAHFGAKSSAALMSALDLKENQVVFFHGHGDTDVGHTKEIIDVLEKAGLDADEWGTMCNIAETSGILYRSLYVI
jgi:hypothetical protein